MRLNEWTFSLTLLVFGLSVEFGKLYVNYGGILERPLHGLSLPTLSKSFCIDYLDTTTQTGLTNYDNQSVIMMAKENSVKTESNSSYKDVNVRMIYKYSWLIKALACGLAMISYSWFIIYKDSSIPGVNPPIPFSFWRHRSRNMDTIQLNYLVGVLNGILVFFYMCL